MNKDQLYKAAFRYKKAGLWRKLWDTQIFAIRLKSGETGYLSIIGKNGEYCALSLYIGDEGFQSYRRTADLENRWFASEFAFREALLQQNCLQLILDTKDYLTEEEIDEVRSYAKTNGIRLSGKNAYPHFRKYEPDRYPWYVRSEEDKEALYEAAEAAVAMAGLLKTVRPRELGLDEAGPDTERIPFFEMDEDGISPSGFAPVPRYEEKQYPEVPAMNEIAVSMVKKLPKEGTAEAELVRLTSPVQEDPDDVPYFPLMLLIVGREDELVLPMPVISLQDERNPENILRNLANVWKEQGVCPEEIYCRDDRTYALLAGFCRKAGVKTEIREENLRILDEVEQSLMEHLQGLDGYAADRMASLAAGEITSIFEMSPEELARIPEDILEQIEILLDEGVFPPEFEERLREKLKGRIR